MIAELQAAGAESLRAIAAGLNARAIKFQSRDRSWGMGSRAREARAADHRPKIEKRMRDLRARGMGLIKISREPGVGIGTVQRIVAAG